MFSKVMGGAIVVLLIAIFFLWRSNGNLREDLGAANTALDQAALANEQNVANFDTVNNKLTACVEQAAADQAANEVTVANLEARYARLEVRSREVEIRREEIFRDPNCAELRDLDMHAICPDWASELRQRAATLGQNRDTGSEGAGTDTDAGALL